MEHSHFNIYADCRVKLEQLAVHVCALLDELGGDLDIANQHRMPERRHARLTAALFVRGGLEVKSSEEVFDRGFRLGRIKPGGTARP